MQRQHPRKAGQVVGHLHWAAVPGARHQLAGQHPEEVVASLAEDQPAGSLHRYRPPQPSQCHTAHTQSARSRRSPPLHQDTRRTYHHCPQSQHRTAGSSSALHQAQCQAHRSHTLLQSQHSLCHMAGTDEYRPWAQSPQHTGCTLRPSQPIQVHTAGKQSCLRSAQCRQHTRRMCRPIQRSRQHSSHTPPG